MILKRVVDCLAELYENQLSAAHCLYIPIRRSPKNHRLGSMMAGDVPSRKAAPTPRLCLVVMSACFYTLRISPVFSKEWKSESEVRDPKSEEMMLVLGHVTIRKHGWRGWKAGLVYVVVHARSCCCCRLPIFCPSMSGSLTTEPHISRAQHIAIKSHNDVKHESCVSSI